MPEISVIVPLYNARKYLQEAIDSVLAQTFQDFEIIVVDDCSTDGSWELVNRLYGENEKISLYRHEGNKTAGSPNGHSRKQNPLARQYIHKR